MWGMLFITHRAAFSFTANHRQHYPAAVPEVICTAMP
jgi:hypothetical protein